MPGEQHYYSDEDYRSLHKAHCLTEERRAVLEKALRELLNIDGSRRNVANAEVLAARVRAVALTALLEDRKLGL